MQLKTVNFNGTEYPHHETIGGASRWIIPMAQLYCNGLGLDIGYSKEEWKLPGAIGIEPSINPEYDAMNLPDVPKSSSFNGWDYLFSSHVLEHVKENVYNVLDYWLSKLRVGGILFLYLPHISQEYWNTENNRKHIHEFNGHEIEGYLRRMGHSVVLGGCDINHSFVVICEKL